MYGIKRRLDHTQHDDICQHDITVLYLMPGMVAVNLHVIAVFDEIALVKDYAHNSPPPGMMRSFVNSTVIFFLMVTSGGLLFH